MGGLQILLFGDMRVISSDCCDIPFPTRKSKFLLAYLVLRSNRALSRLSLAEVFWPGSDETHGQRSLNTELWRVRRSLTSAGCRPDHYLCGDGDTVGFRPGSQHWCDVSAFDNAMSGVGRSPTRALEDSSLAALADAVALYRGDLIDGCLDEWCLTERERYRSRLVAALEFLLDASIQDQAWCEVIGYAQRLLNIDPLLEHVHRSLMRCHCLSGNRPAALRQYHQLVHVLHEELHIEPMNETRRLYDTIVADSWKGSPSLEAARPVRIREPNGSPAAKIDLALFNLHMAQSCLEEAWRQLRER